MVCRITTFHWLPMLALGLTCAGCAELASRRRQPDNQAAASIPSGPTAVAAQPLPSLQIADPAPLAALAHPNNTLQPASHTEPSPLPALERIVPVAQSPALPPPSQPAGQLRLLHSLAERRYASVEGYIVRFKRRETIGGKNHPEEILLLKFRKEPWSVYLRWLGGEGKGREVLYVPGRHGNQIHSLTSAVDVPLPGMAGKHVKTAPDSPLVLARCRYPIEETGVGALIDRFGRVVDALERGDGRLGSLRCLGPIRRPEFDTPVEAVMQLIPPGAEKALPRGGQRFWFFDTNLRFPILVVAQDEVGNEVEYYCYDRFLFPDRLRDEEFDPERLWGR